jgi:purine nucleosidase
MRIAEPADRYWPESARARPFPPGAALDLLASSIEQGATLVAIGPYTNLAMLELARPGSLDRTPVVVMGGWVTPPDDGLPEWGPERDWNVQWDTRAASIVAGAASDLTLATLPVTLPAQLREADLPRLIASGPLGALIAEQSRRHAADTGKGRLGRVHSGLPEDMLNFHYDPIAAATAVGWPGVRVERMGLRTVLDDGVLRFQPDPAGRLTGVVVGVDGAAFTLAWLAAVEAAQSTGLPKPAPASG